MRVLLRAYSGCIFLGRRCMMSVYEYGSGARSIYINRMLDGESVHVDTIAYTLPEYSGLYGLFFKMKPNMTFFIGAKNQSVQSDRLTRNPSLCGISQSTVFISDHQVWRQNSIICANSKKNTC